jgi:hypothetical protein
MRLQWVFLLLCGMLGACASAPKVARPDHLLNDAAFAPPSERINADDVFAVSDAMRRYLHADIANKLSQQGKQRGLIQALYQRDQLKLDYDSAMTRNAAQAFDARAGNCLSLVIMTAALAKELGPAGQVPQRLGRRGLEPHRQPVLPQRPRQHHARLARRRHGCRGARDEQHHGRLPAAAGLGAACAPSRSAKPTCWRCS